MAAWWHMLISSSSIEKKNGCVIYFEVSFFPHDGLFAKYFFFKVAKERGGGYV